MQDPKAPVFDPILASHGTEIPDKGTDVLIGCHSIDQDRSRLSIHKVNHFMDPISVCVFPVVSPQQVPKSPNLALLAP